ncbi:HAUS augmin-like complex subunit 6 N-terminus-domain-containing protein [Glomus cerebriforme]|uniref:HAUS augmin-like complex subunit 6 N-terminus-domain-containing protein n=1 Tax=Glomus cerebriforme TaxID=658196 RepID=A0A397SJP1_9GLOM|nr:HAUS augmin-like complex subunit 6 N-terminus-domain-containing protein [Glomus cerebriforme]
MELIVWFLFNELDDNLAKDRFFDCWPVITYAHSVKFRNIAYKWLEHLKKEGCLGYTDIILRRSAFDECQGERFERIIMAFSNYVIKVSLDREHQDYCQVFPNNFKILKESTPDLLKAILKIHIKIQTDKFIIETQERLACQENWKNLANILTERLHDITEKKNELEREISEFYKGKLVLETFDDLSIEQISSIKLQKLEIARSTWNLCISWIKNNQNFTGSIEDIIYDRANKYRLDGQELLLEVPEIMMTIWENFFQKERINPYQGGKKDLKSLLKLWRFSLQTLIEHHRTKGLSCNKYDKFENENLSCTLNKLEEYLSAQQEQAKSLFSLKNLLRRRLNEIDKSIRLLRVDHSRSLTLGYNEDTEGRNMFVTLKVPSFNFKCDIFTNQIDDDKEMVELKLGHKFTTPKRKRSVQLIEFNKLQEVSIPKPTDMKKGLKSTSNSRLNMTKLSEKPSLATKLPVITKTPLDILTIDIVDHVANEEDSPLSHLPPQYANEEGNGVDFKVHSICEPLNAMGEEMFKPKKEIMRTPRNSNSTPQTRTIKSALKPETGSKATSIRSVRFDTPTPLMDETPPTTWND